MENRISAGSFDLNKFLYGGYETDIITTLYGPAASGKTNLCLLAAVSQAKKGNKVIFIDTEGGFSLDRVKQLSLDRYKEVLENIMVFKVTSFEDQKKAINNLLKEIKEKGKLGLIIVDGMTMLYRLEKAERKENIQEINSELARQLKLLAEISRLKNIPVIITNQIYTEFLTDEEKKSGIQPEIKMVGGDILKYW
ncbi:MAG: DNA repair and recombination protein RadB, partial [Candidatus Pacearchaeota archaeon]|nr:DNA repair and recombination protein RadB [Candidatus Pacearchaeota archaeon]